MEIGLGPVAFLGVKRGIEPGGDEEETFLFADGGSGEAPEVGDQLLVITWAEYEVFLFSSIDVVKKCHEAARRIVRVVIVIFCGDMMTIVVY